MKILPLFVVSLSGLLAAGAAMAGAKIEILIDDKLANTKHTSHISVTDDGMRMDGGGVGAIEPYGVIVFNKTNKMVMLQHNAKKYMEFTDNGVFAQYNQNKDKIAQQYEKAFEKMSPEKREMMKNMLPGFKPKPKVKYVKGKADKVAGYACTNYKKYEGDRLTQEYCFTKSKKFAKVLEATKKAEKIWSKIYPGESNDFFKGEYGIPLKTINYDRAGKIADTQTLTKYEPKVLFKKSPIAVPAGYTKQNMDQKQPVKKAN